MWNCVITFPNNSIWTHTAYQVHSASTNSLKVFVLLYTHQSENSKWGFVFSRKLRHKPPGTNIPYLFHMPSLPPDSILNIYKSFKYIQVACLGLTAECVCELGNTRELFEHKRTHRDVSLSPQISIHFNNIHDNDKTQQRVHLNETKFGKLLSSAEPI